jgi:hypothetical protein
MAKAIRAHNLGAKVTIALLAALLVVVGLVFAVQLTTTTGEGSGTPAMSADRAGGSSFARDPYVERHAAVVTRYRNRADATSEDSAGTSDFARDPAIERHAEIVARHNRGTLR